ncbi:MAG TPA: SIS domain-containing protein [Candidatus Dormibacteraeota bacterium]
MSHAERVRAAYAAAVAALDLTPVGPAADALAARLQDGGLLHALGCGHSQALALEGYHRAGAPAWVAPLLDARLDPGRGAEETATEHTEGLGRELVARLDPTRARALLLISNSGRAAVLQEAALAARGAGLLTIAITSPGPDNRLALAVEHVLATNVPNGDAVVEISGARMAPLSTVVGAVLLHALLAETEARLGAGTVLVSVHVAGGERRNATLLDRYPHLRP